MVDRVNPLESPEARCEAWSACREARQLSGRV